MLSPTAVRRNTQRKTSSDNKLEQCQKHVVFAILLERGCGSWRPRIFRSAGARPPRFRSWLDFTNSSAPKESKTRCFEPILKMSFLRGPSRVPCWPRRRSSETPSGELPQKNGHNNYQKHVVFYHSVGERFWVLASKDFPARLAPPPTTISQRAGFQNISL